MARCFLIVFNVFAVFGIVTVTDAGPSTNQTSIGPFSPRWHYQNLTQHVNLALIDGDSATDAFLNLKSALKLSSLVYYETDLLLEDINQIIPIIDLLNRAKPSNETSIEIKLGLNYVNLTSGQLLETRLRDIYFRPRMSLSESAKSKISLHVTSIAINLLQTYDFYNLVYDYRWNLEERKPLVHYVKNFLRFHFSNRSRIPVGLALPYSIWANNLDDGILWRQWTAADFVALNLRPINFFDASNYNKALMNIDTFLNTNKTKGVRLQLIPTFLQFPMSSPGNPYRYGQSITDYLRDSPYYNETSQEVYKTFWRAVGNMAPRFAVDWADKNSHTLILSYLNGQIPETEKPDMEPNIVPEFMMPDMDGYFPQLKKNLTNVRGKCREAIFNTETWGTLVRHSNSWTTSANSETLNAILKWTLSPSQSLNTLWDYMSDLVSPDHLPRGVNLTSFVIDQDEMNMFPEIWSRLSQNGSQSLSLGCSLVYHDTFVRTVPPNLENTFARTVPPNRDYKFARTVPPNRGYTFARTVPPNRDYTVARTVPPKGADTFGRTVAPKGDDTFGSTIPPNGDDFKSKISRNVCSPLFSSVKTFIWRVYFREDIYYFGTYSTGVDTEFYDYVFQVMLTREVFLKEFPDKQVIIEVRSRHFPSWIPTYYKAPFALDFTR